MTEIRNLLDSSIPISLECEISYNKSECVAGPLVPGTLFVTPLVSKAQLGY